MFCECIDRLIIYTKTLLTTIISESDDSGQRKKALTDYIQIICREAMLRGDIDLNALARQRRGETKQ